MKQNKILLTALLVLALVCVTGGCAGAPADEPAPSAPTTSADGGGQTADPAAGTDTAPATLSVVLADDAALPADYDSYSEGTTDYSVRALLTTDRTVTDLRLVTLTVGDDGSGGLVYTTGETLYQLRSFAVLFLLGLAGATPWPKKWGLRLSARYPLAEVLAMGGLLLVCTGYLVDGSFNPFLYFRF